jgi:hypothetical protein
MSGILQGFIGSLGGARAPDAPTIGTATATGSTTATVSFTAPSNDGGSPITSYTVTSSPGGITATGSSSPITITGLTNNTSYTFTVRASNAVGTSTASGTSNSITTALVAGEPFEGGFFAGYISTNGDGIETHYLIVSPKSSGQNTNRRWKTATTTTAGTTSVIDGPTNSTNMNNANHPAAEFCEGLTIGGFSDWYLPAKNELEVCYFNLKPLSGSNDTSSGANTNAVPSRAGNYTDAPNVVPAQTTSAAFQSGGSEALAAEATWTSTQLNATQAWFQGLDAGAQTPLIKTVGFHVRAVRRVPV